MKHTPGPWKVKENGKHETPSVWSANEFGMRREICRVKDASCNGEYKYNAALIAAAPELLKSLEGYARMTEKVLSMETFSEKDLADLKTALRFIAPQTRAVIAKAQGLQPS